MNKVLAVIPTYLSEPGDVGVLRDCLESLRRTATDVDVLVVDDCSPALELVDQIEADKSRLEFQVHRSPSNEGFSATVNVGLRRALQSGQDALLVNADIEFFDQGWLAKMLGQQRSDDNGPAEVVGALLLYPNGLIQHAGVYFSLLHRTFGHIYQYAPGDLHEAQYARRCPVTGALQLIRHDTLKTVGIYDERFRMGFEDVDYGIRTFLAGGECVMQPRVRAYHYESMFRGRPNPKVEDWQARSWLWFTQKYAQQNFSEWVPSVI